MLSEIFVAYFFKKKNILPYSLTFKAVTHLWQGWGDSYVSWSFMSDILEQSLRYITNSRLLKLSQQHSTLWIDEMHSTVQSLQYLSHITFVFTYGHICNNLKNIVGHRWHIVSKSNIKQNTTCSLFYLFVIWKYMNTCKIVTVHKLKVN